MSNQLTITVPFEAARRETIIVMHPLSYPQDQQGVATLVMHTGQMLAIGRRRWQQLHRALLLKIWQDVELDGGPGRKETMIREVRAADERRSRDWDDQLEF
ncbi:hypothetical protein PRIPAC_92101 [Pristionchus pacificus]|uniref:Uncharacterized protein n=1 Tax=Pristionchus pacificus TaxID=54126 RepID=A0A2A6CE85_PRIPA|nr:hypothetical protein PRIPAC_92101 [Pristionchus pacificus]|eukprot:PDM76363.1 hypothetical protein PRIPAC_39967 [Pristionchus pacificus]